MKDYNIKLVLKKRGFIRVVFTNGVKVYNLDFADKYGQYTEFKIEKRKNVKFEEDYLKLYVK